VPQDKVEREAWKVAPLPDLVRHLVGTCHLECRVDMARLETMIELASMEEGHRDPALNEIREMIGRFCTGMRAHLALEERKLFPFILGLGDGGAPEASQEALASLREHLEEDHEAEAGLLRNIRGMSSALPEASDPTCPQGLIHEALRTLSERLQKHLYLEKLLYSLQFPPLPS